MAKIKYTKEQIKHLLATDPEFVNSPKWNYSLSRLLANKNNGVTDQFAARLLFMTLEEFKEKRQEVINKYRQSLKVVIQPKDE